MGPFDAETDPAPTIAFQQIFGEDVGYKVEQLEDKDWARVDGSLPPHGSSASGSDLPELARRAEPDAVNVMLTRAWPSAPVPTPPRHSARSGWTGWIWLAKPSSTLVAASGILGIAALKLGSCPAIGIDIDPPGHPGQPVTTPSEMALPTRSNSTCRRISRRRRSGTWWSPTSLAGPLRELAPLIAGHGKAGSLMALSGVLKARRQSWRPIWPVVRDGPDCGEEWCRLSGQTRLISNKPWQPTHRAAKQTTAVATHRPHTRLTSNRPQSGNTLNVERQGTPGCPCRFRTPFSFCPLWGEFSRFSASR